jgi:hypothetical protein
MKRLCFYCFWSTDYPRLIRRRLAKEYYVLTDDQLLAVPFFPGISIDNSERRGYRRLEETLRLVKPASNDLGSDTLIKEVSLQLYGSEEWIRRARMPPRRPRTFEYDEPFMPVPVLSLS